MKKWGKRDYTKEKIFATLLQNLESARRGYYTIGQIYYLLETIYDREGAKDFLELLYNYHIADIQYAQNTTYLLSPVAEVKCNKESKPYNKLTITYKDGRYYYPRSLHIKLDDAINGFNKFVTQRQNPNPM